MSVDEATVRAFLERELEGIDTLDAKSTRFYYYDPRRDIPHDKRQPFATIMSDDDWDAVSDLARPGVYRVNLGVELETYRALLGAPPAWGKDGGVIETPHDLRALDTFLPHPYYAPMGWICILSPSERSWPRLQALLREAHALARHAYERRAQPP